MDKDSLLGLMVAFTKEIGETIKRKAKVSISGPMDKYMLVILKQMTVKASESYIIQMEKDLKAAGSKVKNMEQVGTNILMDKNT